MRLLSSALPSSGIRLGRSQTWSIASSDAESEVKIGETNGTRNSHLESLDLTFAHLA